ncbi:ribonuclease H-like domain-containing protein [Tanacetum coccineum]
MNNFHPHKAQYSNVSAMKENKEESVVYAEIRIVLIIAKRYNPSSEDHEEHEDKSEEGYGYLPFGHVIVFGPKLGLVLSYEMDRYRVVVGLVLSYEIEGYLVVVDGYDIAYLLLYVDDIILTTSSLVFLQRIIVSLHSEFAMTDLGSLNYFLGISAQRSTSGLFLSQSKFVEEILERAHIQNWLPGGPLFDSLSKLGSDGGPL